MWDLPLKQTNHKIFIEVFMMKKIWKVLLGSGIGILLIIIIIIYRQKGDFSKKGFILTNNVASRQYREHSFMDDMDMSVFEPYLYLDVAQTEAPYLKEFELPFDLIYYKRIENNMNEAFVIPKATKVYVDSTDTMKLGVGFYSFPTHKRGWRYVRPFITDKQEDSSQFYYVKLKDLEKSYLSLLKEDDYLKKDIIQQGYSLEEYAHLVVRLIDRILYNNGIYCSLD